MLNFRSNFDQGQGSPSSPPRISDAVRSYNRGAAYIHPYQHFCGAAEKCFRISPKRHYTIAPPSRHLCWPFPAAQSKMLTHFPTVAIIPYKVDAEEKNDGAAKRRKGLWPANRFSMNPALPDSSYHSAAQPTSMQAFPGGAIENACRHFPEQHYTIAPPGWVLCEPLLAALPRNAFAFLLNDIIPQKEQIARENRRADEISSRRWLWRENFVQNRPI